MEHVGLAVLEPSLLCRMSRTLEIVTALSSNRYETEVTIQLNCVVEIISKYNYSARLILLFFPLRLTPVNGNNDNNRRDRQ